MTTLTGVTWGHRRAIDPLLAASRHFAEISGTMVDWRPRSLGDFEHQPLPEAALACDLMVFDHPFCGVIASAGCFLPLSELLPVSLRPESFIGKSLESYRFANRLWGAPVDGACNHALFRHDLLPEPARVPEKWAEVVELGRDLARHGRSLAIAANGHHGLLAVAALCANLGKAWPNKDRSAFAIDRPALEHAIEALREVLAYCPPESLDWNSIAVHDAMVSRDDLAYCPVVFGFAAYGASRPALSFGPLPGIAPPYHAGAVLGGAAIGISAACREPEMAARYLAFLLEANTQRKIFAAHSGQPARIETWVDRDVHRPLGQYFSAVRATMEGAQVRPRFVGYQQFEKRAGDRMEQLMRRSRSASEIASAILEEAERVRDGRVDPPYDRMVALEQGVENLGVRP